MNMFLQTVVVSRAGSTTNQAGSVVPDWKNPVNVTYSNVCVQPLPVGARETETIGTGTDQVVTRWRMFSAPGNDMDVLNTDRVLYNGMTLVVDGEVNRWHDPYTGAVHHIEVVLKRARG
ncbi:MAG: hypothetical protein J2P17_16875 [Mycobacterium sp.]|nr:hypothetical protein [Mycobacterium sp.]